jgi:hypothetical protein
VARVDVDLRRSGRHHLSVVRLDPRVVERHAAVRG